MRIGILEFGLEAAWAAGLIDALRGKDIDTIPGESRIESMETAWIEAKRLSRADCDGVLLLIGAETRTNAVATAGVLLAGVPLLLADAAMSGAFFDCAGILEEIGARFDRMPAEAKYPADSIVESWLNENGKSQRQRGLEAARKLYGQRLHVPLEIGGLPDAALWMHQFGVLPATKAEGADFSASNGDACGVLTAHLLALVAGVPANAPVSVVASHGAEAAEGDTDATFARITRIKGRFRCLLLRGALSANGISAARFDCSDAQLFAAASSPLLYSIPGDYLGAMRAACEALGIETVLLRPA